MSSNEKVSCDDIRDQLIDFLDDQLSNENFALIEEHVKSCLSCRSDLKDLESVSSLLGSMPAVELKKDFASDIESLIVQSDSTVSKTAKNSEQSCDDIKELISPYFDKELESAEYNLVESHLAVCQECSLVLNEIQAVSSVLTGLPRESLGYDLSENIEDLLNNQSQPAQVLPFKRKLLVFSSVAAAMLLFVMLSVPKLMDTSSSDVPTVAKQDPVVNKAVPSVVADMVPESNSKPESNKNVESKVASSALVEKTSKPNKLTASVVSKSQVEEKISKDIASSRVALASPPKVAPSISYNSVSSEELVQSEPENLLSTEAVVAYESDDDDDLFSQMGVSTNEDGLYAIKL